MLLSILKKNVLMGGMGIIIFKMCYCDFIKGLNSEGILIDINLIRIAILYFLDFEGKKWVRRLLNSFVYLMFAWDPTK